MANDCNGQLIEIGDVVYGKSGLGCMPEDDINPPQTEADAIKAMGQPLDAPAVTFDCADKNPAEMSIGELIGRAIGDDCNRAFDKALAASDDGFLGKTLSTLKADSADDGAAPLSISDPHKGLIDNQAPISRPTSIGVLGEQVALNPSSFSYAGTLHISQGKGGKDEVRKVAFGASAAPLVCTSVRLAVDKDEVQAPLMQKRVRDW